ncbi:F-box domain-containing protein [Acanthamoeba castellanii medusavirus]|uniref:F-box domain-containing protein n=1 Tax=Acanthamoeba castellanii medusavirus J1 TaxID=3114988 RepID=A0A3T1CXC7_9VIRU|nr:F-box domain-containing protein [Acanthamoeba castellanii medusavirus]BBI30449.1 F-box domain-containing protein [Acanthamoeba castellanii medusavirus J1]
MSSINELPEEVTLSILQYGSPEDLYFGFPLVSRLWRRLSRDNQLWRRHLDDYHPRWRQILRRMDVKVRKKTSLRRCVRHLAEAHEPEPDSDCCKHDDTKGAVCTCCTCRRHHAGQKWEAHRPFLLKDDGETTTIMTMAYDAEDATMQTLTEVDSDGESDSDSEEEFRRVFAEAGKLERRGLLEIGEVVDYTERVRWTKYAHRVLRPPLTVDSVCTVCYSDAELYVALMEHHPELCDRTLIDRCGVIIELCGKRFLPVYALWHTFFKEWDFEGFLGAVDALVGAGWLERTWQCTIRRSEAAERVFASRSKRNSCRD